MIFSKTQNRPVKQQRVFVRYKQGGVRFKILYISLDFIFLQLPDVGRIGNDDVKIKFKFNVKSEFKFELKLKLKLKLKLELKLEL